MRIASCRVVQLRSVRVRGNSDPPGRLDNVCIQNWWAFFPIIQVVVVYFLGN